MVTAERRGPVPFDLAVAASLAGHGVRVCWAGRTEQTGRLTVAGPDFEHHVYLERGAGEPIALADGWRSDARVAIIRYSEGGGPRDMLLVGAAHLWRRIRSVQLMQA